MNQESDFKFFWRKKRTVFVLGIILGIGGFLVAYFYPPKYVASISFTISRVNRQDTSEYQYDGYYAIRATDLFADTILSWFITPSVLLEIYEKAHLDPQIKSLTSFTSRFKTKKYSPQNLVVKFTEKSKKRAENLSAAIISILEEKAVKINTTPQNEPLFSIAASKPVIVETKPSTILYTFLGFVLGIALGIIYIYLNRFIKENLS